MPETKTPAYSDAARRIADEMTMHTLAGSVGSWAAFALADGQPMGHVAFDTRIEAVTACRWDRDNFVYLQVSPDGMQPKEAEAFLAYARFLHDQGWRLPNPEFDFDASMPTFAWDRAAMARHLISGGKSR